MAKKPQENYTKQTAVVEQTQDSDLYVISDYLKSVKFSPRLMGVDEADVWKKIEKLCELYEDALIAERGKSEKLERQLKACRARLRTALAAEKKAEEPHGE